MTANGMLKRDILALDTLWTDNTAAFPYTDLEPLATLEKRVLGFIKEITKKHPNQNVLIMSHEDPLFIMRGFLTNTMKNREYKNLPPINNCDVMPFNPAG